MTKRWPFLAALLLTGCSTSNVAPPGGGVAARVTGTVAYRERIALPSNAVIKVQLVDVSRADAPAVVIGEQIFEAGGKQVPFAFVISYDATKVDERMSYAVQARIEEDGQLRFINDQHYPVITRDAPTKVHLMLRSVGVASR